MKAWGDLEGMLPGSGPVTRGEIAAISIRWLTDKWVMRCEMASKVEGTAEKARLLKRCQELWARRKEVCILEKDKGLFEERQEPNERHSLDYLRSWEETRVLALRDFDQYKPSETQRSIREWIRPAQRRRVVKGERRECR